VDGSASEAERASIGRHLATCAECRESAEGLRTVRKHLLELPRRVPSKQLQMAIQVVASRDRSRRLTRRTLAGKWHAWTETAKLTIHNLMRPLMLPVGGGLLAATMLFGVLVPDVWVELHPIRNDIPTVLFTEASVKETIPIAISENDIILDLHVDDQGRMTEYHVVSGQNMLQNQTIRRRLETTLLLTQFTPATSFGQPTPGKIRVSFRTSRIDVKG
jgi:hypothetical protein